MDKETLSNYGWIVICVLVLAVMIALATPFGTFISDAVKSTTNGLYGASQKAMTVAGLNTSQNEWDNTPNVNDKYKEYRKYDTLKDGTYYTDTDALLTDLNNGVSQGTESPSGEDIAYLKSVGDEMVVVLLKDLEINTEVPVMKNSVFNTNGKNVTFGDGACFTINNVDFTLYNGKENGAITKNITPDGKSKEYIINASGSSTGVVKAINVDIKANIDSANSSTYLIVSKAECIVQDVKIDANIKNSKQAVLIRTASDSKIDNVTVTMAAENMSGTHCAINTYSGKATLSNINIKSSAAANCTTGIIEGIQVGTECEAIITSANIDIDAPFSSEKSGSWHNAQGFAVDNYGKLTLKGDTEDAIYMRATREAINNNGSLLEVYNGTYEGCQHGAAYIAPANAESVTNIYGGTFRHIKYWGDNKYGKENYLTNTETNEKIYGYGAMYLGGADTGFAATINISNANIEGITARHGIAIKENSGSKLKLTVNITDCYISGHQSDLRCDSGKTVNLYGNTILEHNTTQINGKLNDNRE